MKLRLRGNSIRLRLGKAEVETLAGKGILSETTLFAPGQTLTWTVESSASEKSVRTEYTQAEIHFYIPQAQAEAWATNDTVGLYAKGTTQIAIEKDFKCLEERDEEDDKDAFPNPQAQKG